MVTDFRAMMLAPSMIREESVMDADTRTRVAIVVGFLFVLGASDLFAAMSAFAQAWPPPPQTVPSIGLKTPDPTTAFPGAVPSIGLKTSDPTTAFPGAVPSVGLKTSDPTTAFPGAVPSIGLKTPDPTTAPSIGTSP
jgi:hypothetical protein